MGDDEARELLTATLDDLGDGNATVHVSGEIDISSAEVITARFQEIASGQYRNVILDTSEVTFMDSSGLHALIECKRILHDSGTRVILVSSKAVKRILELVFPEPLFAMRVDTSEEALAALDGS